jgi:hypothetical protein
VTVVLSRFMGDLLRVVDAVAGSRSCIS